MNAEDRKEIQKLNDGIRQIKTVLVGDPEMETKGLIHAQKKDDDFRREARGFFKDVRIHMSDQTKINVDVESRLKTTESISFLFTSCPRYKKAIIIIIGSFSGGAIAFWNDIKEFIHNIIN
jgi:hypothetical protein